MFIHSSLSRPLSSSVSHFLFLLHFCRVFTLFPDKLTFHLIYYVFISFMVVSIRSTLCFYRCPARFFFWRGECRPTQVFYTQITSQQLMFSSLLAAPPQSQPTNSTDHRPNPGRPPLPRVVVVSLFHTFESSIAYPASGPLQGCILTEVHRPRYYLSARACRRGIWTSPTE